MTEDEIAYGLLIKLQGKNYIELQISDDGQYCLSAYHNMKEVKDKFEGFSNKVMSSNYESHISGSIGLINLRPLVIIFPENPQDLSKYIINPQPIQLKGQYLGGFINMVGIEVNQETELLSVYDICGRIINKRFENIIFVDENKNRVNRTYNEFSNGTPLLVQKSLF